MLNHERNREGYGGTSTPHTGNYPFGTLEQPAGENYNNGICTSPETNEEYSWVINSEGVNYISRISDANGLEIAYDGGELQLSAEPRHYITPFRCKLRLDKVYDKQDGISCKNRHGKMLLWTDSLYDIGCLDVEASIATDSFTTPFFDFNPDPGSLIKLCVPNPCVILQGELVPRNITDGLANKILDIGFKFIYRWIYYDGRKSEWSDPSTLYYQKAEGCFENDDSLSRCWNLRVPIGNPQVEKIEIGFSKGETLEDGYTDIWLSYEIIEKYKKYNSTQQYWYERDLSETVIGSNYSEDDWSFDYAFCNDKNCNPIATPRTFNPMPRQPQGLFTINDAEAWFNYIQGSCPIDQFQIDKFNIDLNCTSNECERDLVEVKVRAVIRGRNFDTIEYVYRLGGVFGDSVDDIDEKVFFGGNGGDINNSNGIGQANLFGQAFNKAQNFTAYIEGTSYFVEMKQYQADYGFINPEEYGILSGFAPVNGTSDSNKVSVLQARALSSSKFFYQEAVFKVPKGTRGVIRIRSHSSSLNNGDTSTNVIGTVPLNQIAQVLSLTQVTNVTNIYTPFVQEIAFDTCNRDSIEYNDAFLIDSASYPGVFLYGYEGYITDSNSKPVEGLVLRKSGAVVARTDHNGYYQFFFDKFSVTSNPVSIQVEAELDCSNFDIIQNMGMVGEWNITSRYDTKFSNTFYNKFYEEVRVHVRDCNSNPIGGIKVALTGSKYQISNSSTGIATFKVRNYVTRDRQVRAYIMDNKGCFNFDCNNDCGVCYPQTDLFPLNACFESTPIADIYPTTNLNISILTEQGKGLKSGGRYPMGILPKGDCGLTWDVMELPYLNIPKAQTLGYNSFCSLTYDATGIVFPTGVTCVDIVRGQNLNEYLIQWVVDKFEKTSDNKIKISFQSLKDYDLLFGGKTNVKYNWIEGDRIEFIKDENGEILLESAHGILNYLTVSPFHDTDLSGLTTASADYFNQVLIEDDGKIDFLKAGSVIEFQRSKECTVEPIYFSIGVTLPVVNGVLLNPVGTFSSFDTYQQRRIISNGALIVFEHPSPSDFWGNRISDIGKVYFKNPYANEKRFGKNVTIASPEQINYFGDIVKTIDGVGGDIIAMTIKDGKIIQIISETDNSLAQGADDLLRVGNDGIIRAAAPDAVISDGQPKLSGEYGCRYDDIGSILFGDGFTNWYDLRYYAYVNSNFSVTKSVDDFKAKTYFRGIGIELSSTNKNETNPYNKLRFFTGINYQTKAVNLTVKSFRHSGINNEIKPFILPNSTIRYDNDSEDFLDFASFTPEGYGHLILNDGFGCAMITYLNGIPYIHPVVPANYNEFYGIAVDRVVIITLNQFKEKIKVPISFELQSDMMWFVVAMETSNPNFASEIPPARVKHNLNKWNASFLRNKNSRKGLYEGESARDYYVNITFKRDNTIEQDGRPKYGSINNEKRVRFDILSMILLKYEFSEQSGFTADQQQR